MNKFKIMLCIIGLIGFAFKTFSQQITIKPVLKVDELQVINREISISNDKHQQTKVTVNAQPHVGLVWVKGIQFENGIIEFDVKGKDVLQESFVGIAFHGVNDSTYEAIYFRPFNFNSLEPIRKVHAVQYIALPNYDWPHLRSSFPGKYEASISETVDPNDWFHVKIVVEGASVKTFINSDITPVLFVQSLQPNVIGKLGFWVGNNSDGHFKNLTVTPKK